MPRGAKACASKINEFRRAQTGLYGTYTSKSPLFCLVWTSGLVFVQVTLSKRHAREGKSLRKQGQRVQTGANGPIWNLHFCSSLCHWLTAHDDTRISTSVKLPSNLQATLCKTVALAPTNTQEHVTNMGKFTEIENQSGLRANFVRDGDSGARKQNHVIDQNEDASS